MGEAAARPGLERALWVECLSRQVEAGLRMASLVGIGELPEPGGRP